MAGAAAAPEPGAVPSGGAGKTKSRANQLYAAYAQGRDIRKLMAIVGEDALGDLDKRYLRFAREFEAQMTGQGATRRTIDDTLSLGWQLLTVLPRQELTRLSRELIDQYYDEAEKNFKPAIKS